MRARVESAERLVAAARREIVEKLLLDAEGPPPDVDFGLAGALDLAQRAGEKVLDVSGTRRRADRRDRPSGSDVWSRAQNGGAAQRMSHEERRRTVLVGQEIGCGDEVADV